MSWLLDKFVEFDDDGAIVHKGVLYTYKQLVDEVEQLRCYINDNNIKHGEVVAILSDYSFSSIALLIALYINKNIVVPITSTVEKEVKDRVEESYCNKIVRINEKGYELEDIPTNAEHEMIKRLQEEMNSGLVLFSSGSSGKPKAMIHSLDHLMDKYQGKNKKSISMIVFLMFDHIGGFNTLFNILSMGAKVVIPESRDANEICKLLQEYKIRVLPCSPTFLNLILISKAYENYDLSALRMVTYGTETMPESLLEKLQEVFPRVKFLQTYGTSETGIVTTSSKSSTSTLMKFDDDNIEYKVVNDELWLRSNTQVLGYLNTSTDRFTDDGWFRTGDLVEVTNDGFLKIIGRNKEVINVGGEKVLPAEVESIILSMDEVEDVMAYGEKNVITGQTVVVDIVLSDAMDNKEAKRKVRSYCRGKLDNYKIPTKVNVVSRTNYGERFKKVRNI